MRANRDEEKAGTEDLEYYAYVFGDMFSAYSQDGQNARINATDSVRFLWAWPFRLDRVYYSIKSHRTH